MVLLSLSGVVGDRVVVVVSSSCHCGGVGALGAVWRCRAVVMSDCCVVVVVELSESLCARRCRVVAVAVVLIRCPCRRAVLLSSVLVAVLFRLRRRCLPLRIDRQPDPVRIV